VVAFAYNDDGVWFLNSWGDQWGFNGWGLLSWDFVNGTTTNAGSNVFMAYTIDGIVH
jgi:C1A family cysteine protease